MKILVCLALMLSLISFNETQEKTLKWEKNRKLKFEDFTASPKVASEVSALSCPTVDASIKISNNCVSYKIFAVFVGDSSWIKVNDTFLLNHEQRHFDICEIYSRIIKKGC